MSRGKFLSYSAMVGAAGVIGVPSLLSSCGSGDKSAKGGAASAGGYTPLQSEIPVYIPDLKAGKAVDGRLIKAGIIGCGSRGSGAAMDFLSCGDNLTITAMADIFTDRLESLRAHIKKEKSIEVADDQIWYGFDAYQKLVDNADIDMVIIATPTLFHPIMTKYAIDKGKHVFVEKPAAIDAVGCRTMLAACKTARANNLSIITGTQRHHEPGYNEAYRRVREGWIGDITSGNVYWNQGGPWFVKRKPEWTDMEYMLRDFFSWCWLCGDHIIDQAVHNVDVFAWFSHLKPVSAIGMGGRARRTTGDVYDFWSADLEFENNIHCHVMQRQIDDCANRIGEEIHGTKGVYSNIRGIGHAIYDLDGKVLWRWDEDPAKAEYATENGYMLEHANLVSSIRLEKSVVLAETTVYSSAICDMARESAYHGPEFTYEGFLNSDLDYMPNPLTLGAFPGGMPKAKLPGKSNG